MSSRDEFSLIISVITHYVETVSYLSHYLDTHTLLNSLSEAVINRPHRYTDVDLVENAPHFEREMILLKN